MSAGTGDGRRRRSRFGAAGRLALFPARAAARATRGPIENVADEHLVPELSRIADRAFASDLPEQLARSIAEHHVLERVAAELAESGALDSAVEKALASPRTKETVDHLVNSPAFRQALKDVVSSPEVRKALTEQSAGLAEDLAGDIRRRSVEIDGSIEARVHRRPAAAHSSFAGLATRGVGFAVDLLAIAAIFAVLAGLFALITNIVGALRPAWLAGAIAGGGWLIVAVAYFVFFWSEAGRTPGMHVMHLRVRDRAGRPPSFWRSLLRAAATIVSIVPLFLGYVPVLFDSRRRGLPDLVAGTEVVYEHR
ncbi:MAG: RDD family protein [Gaiellaceae bacterium]